MTISDGFNRVRTVGSYRPRRASPKIHQKVSLTQPYRARQASPKIHQKVPLTQEIALFLYVSTKTLIAYQKEKKFLNQQHARLLLVRLRGCVTCAC